MYKYAPWYVKPVILKFCHIRTNILWAWLYGFMPLYQSLLFVKEWVVCPLMHFGQWIDKLLTKATVNLVHEYAVSPQTVTELSLSTLQHPRLSLPLLQLFVQVSGSCLLQRDRDPLLQYFLEIRDKIQDRAFTYITCMACQNGKKWFLMAESERSIVIRIPSVCVLQTKKKKPLVAQVRRTCTVLGKIFA